MNRKEVACPTVVHNTAFDVVVEGFKPLDNGRAKPERNKCFLYKRPFHVSNAFSKSRKSRSPGIFLAAV